MIRLKQDAGVLSVVVLFILSRTVESIMYDEDVCEWFCDDGSCIKNDELCDGIEHCDDGSDEISKNCKDLDCPCFTFRCHYGACVRRSAKCDGLRDCADGSDELRIYCDEKRKRQKRDVGMFTQRCGQPSAKSIAPYHVGIYLWMSKEAVMKLEMARKQETDMMANITASELSERVNESENKTKRETNLESDTYRLFCAGSIISPLIVITAAHCLRNARLGGSFLVIAGNKYPEYDDVPNEHIQKSSVFDLFTPASYKPETSGDVAIFTLAKSLKFTPYVSPLCINTHNPMSDIQPDAGSEGYVVTWNAHNRTGGRAFSRIPTKVISRLECLERLKPVRPKYFLEVDKFCVVYDYERTKDELCAGDGGAGFVVTGITTEGFEGEMLLGVVSHIPTTEKGCAANHIPTTYAANGLVIMTYLSSYGEVIRNAMELALKSHIKN